MYGSVNRRCGVAILLSAVGAAAAALAAEPAGPALTLTKNEATVTVARQAQTVMQYRCQASPLKPYVAQLSTPGGVQVLRDSPADHKHHHALMFAVGVDGVSYWEETNRGGREKPRTLATLPVTARHGLTTATLTQQLDWLPPEADQPVLSEDRRLEVYAGGDLPATLLTWQTRLQPAAGKAEVKLTGSHYYGLGMRFIESMDKGGRFFNSAGEPGEIVRGSERLAAARWCAYAAKADGKPVTVAIFDDPKNVRHPNKFFSMSPPFAYLAATLNLWKQPLTLKAGDTLALRYGVALWDGEVEPAQVEALYQRWLKLIAAE